MHTSFAAHGGHTPNFDLDLMKYKGSLIFGSAYMKEKIFIHIVLKNEIFFYIIR